MTNSTYLRPCGRPAEIRLVGPFKHHDINFMLKRWGVPPAIDWLSIDALTHHSRGGWGHFTLPDAGAIAAYIRKARKHPDAAAALLGLAKVALFSHLDLGDALNLSRRLMSEHPHIGQIESVHEWREFGLLALQVIMARWPGGVGLRDPRAAILEIMGLRDDLNRAEFAIADRRHADLRAKFGQSS